ncbi:hypothetical protein PHYPSEUDO_006609 [Phytophthora pseudosyringae]|uniref:Uncharacterized protein n=1 Tax=Phytophthora pseudosyringae TaxID=221518 RepID=A0A8T1VI64_9STRA|nr:hypothetical protein PHYPSEUDO_006609 [Phytophthora pseudosyringae]
MSRSIEREKKRRDSGLSALLAHEWRGQHQQLMKCVLESQGIERAHASHQKLSAAYSKLVQNDRVVEALQMKLKGLMRAADFCQEERTDALMNLSSQLDGALNRRLQLKTKCATRCVDMLLSNDSIWTTVNTLMTEDSQTSL